MFDQSDAELIFNAVKQQAENYPKFIMAATSGEKCHVCGMELIEKGDWVFCPKNSTDIPDCDSGYHIARNMETGFGWTTAVGGL